MAINPLIALGGQPIDTATPLQNMLTIQDLKQRRDMQQQQLAQGERRLAADERMTDLRERELNINALAAEDQRRLTNNVVDSLRAKAALETGGKDGLNRFLAENYARNEAAGLDSRETLQVFDMANSGNIEDVQRMLDFNINVGERLGILQPGQKPDAPVVREFTEGDQTVSRQWDAATGKWVPLSSGPRFAPDKPDGPGSPIGKLIRDREAFASQYGEGSPQVAAIDEAIKGEGGDKAGLSDVAGMRKEYTKLSSDFIATRDALKRIEVGAKNPSAAGDIALIFNFMKMQDPGSTVREGEFATAQNAAGVPEQVKNTYNRLISGERLSPEQRQDFLGTARSLFDEQLVQQKQLAKTFSALAESQNIDPSQVAIDFIGDLSSLDAPSSAPQKPVTEMSDEELMRELNGG